MLLIFILIILRDRKKKKYVVQGEAKKMVKTESGNRIPATFKSSRYRDWAVKHNMDRWGMAWRLKETA